MSDTTALTPEQQRRLDARQARQDREITREEVLRRNYAERVKAEKQPFALASEFGRLAETSYEQVSEDDVLRLQWFGLYHDKPKVGEFMMRIKIPNGILTPLQLRTIGEISVRFGQNESELTTRQDIQLHHITMKMIPDLFPWLERCGLTSKGGCGDVLRNITGCPLAGIDPEELFDPSGLVFEAHRRIGAHPAYGDLPRKHKWSISACPSHCNAPEIHDIALVGAQQDGEQGFAVWVGGGLSSAPRIAKPLGVFVKREEAIEVCETLMDLWRQDLKYRVSRSKARFKFMVDDYGPEKIRGMLEARLGRKLTELKQNPRPLPRNDHMGIHRQKGDGNLFYLGYPVFAGRLSGEQLINLANIVERHGKDIRLTRQQNLIVTGVPELEIEKVESEIQRQIGLSTKVNSLRAKSIGCTGWPLCNFAVGETKLKMMEIVEHLEQQLGEAAGELHLHLDGCPHSCGQHWVGDIGIQGTTLTTPDGKIQAYDVLLRGGLGPEAGIGKAVMRRVPTKDVKHYVERLMRGYLQTRQGEETIPGFFRRHSDEALQAMAKGDPLPITPPQTAAPTV